MVKKEAKFTTMYARFLKPPNYSFFLFGSRATGKTTWLKNNFSNDNALFFDLLNNKTFLELSADPDLLIKKILASNDKPWVIIDEIQRVPNLLNTIHRVFNEYNNKFKFVLSGSSARKIRQQNSNLLAGRAISREFYPLVGHEMEYEFDVEKLLRYGCLPQVVSFPDNSIDILEAYVVNYLQQEIQQEALTRNLDAFNRFLKVAGIMNGRVINISNIARDSGVSRTTVERYFSILIDTLIASWVPAWNPRLKVKEIKSPKFYFFDSGLVRALTGQLREPLDSFEKGYYLETLVLNELRAWISYANIGGEISYWSSDGRGTDKEIDFIWSRGKTHIGFEIKSSKTWRREYGKYLREFKDNKKLHKAYGIYLGEENLVDDGIEVLNIKTFMQKLFSDQLLK